MGLSKKTFLYSILLAAVMVVFITVYFVFMLPSLYVDYVTDSNFDSVVRIQKEFMEKRSYDGLSVKNPSSVFSLEIPREGETLRAAGKFFTMTVTVEDRELQEILQLLRSKAGSAQELKEFTDPEKLKALWEKIKKRFAGQSLFAENYPLRFQVENKQGRESYHGEYEKFHPIADNLFVYEMGVSDGDYEYTTYFAFGQTKDALIFTVLPAMTPQMEEIKPVVMGSIPMIVAVVFLLVFIASRLFAGRIVHPVIRLAGCAEQAKRTDHFDKELFPLGGKDEIGELSRTLHELYERLHENYQELERKNAVLAEENERQEVFLRASSHQLKTPVAAAMLLVEGMMAEVGKYRDTKTYLPEVKRQLMTMQHIIQDILYLNYHTENMAMEQVDLRPAAGGHEAAGSDVGHAEHEPDHAYVHDASRLRGAVFPGGREGSSPADASVRDRREKTASGEDRGAFYPAHGGIYHFCSLSRCRDGCAETGGSLCAGSACRTVCDRADLSRAFPCHRQSAP